MNICSPINKQNLNSRPKISEAQHLPYYRSGPISRRPVLLLSDDDEFCRDLSRAAKQAGQSLIRRSAIDGPYSVRALKPVAVLLDLDQPAGSAWDTVDSLLEDEYCPVLILLSSRSDQPEVGAAIQSGSVIDKSAEAAAILQQVNRKLKPSGVTLRDANAMQRIVIRWLKPCNLSAEVVPLRRFWGINE